MIDITLENFQGIKGHLKPWTGHWVKDSWISSSLSLAMRSNDGRLFSLEIRQKWKRNGYRSVVYNRESLTDTSLHIRRQNSLGHTQHSRPLFISYNI